MVCADQRPASNGVDTPSSVGDATARTWRDGESANEQWHEGTTCLFLGVTGTCSFVASAVMHSLLEIYYQGWRNGCMHVTPCSGSGRPSTEPTSAVYMSLGCLSMIPCRAMCWIFRPSNSSDSGRAAGGSLIRRPWLDLGCASHESKKVDAHAHARLGNSHLDDAETDMTSTCPFYTWRFPKSPSEGLGSGAQPSARHQQHRNITD